MARGGWIKLQMTIAELDFDTTVAEIKKVSERFCSIMGFCSEDEKAEQDWDWMMKALNQYNHETFLEHCLQHTS